MNANKRKTSPGSSLAGHGSMKTPISSPSKRRSLSDVVPTLSPSPKFREAARSTQDDILLPAHPTTPRRPNLPVRGLSLQMPSADATSLGASDAMNRAPPLSPKLDLSNTYGSPSSALPRRSRGLDFSRACTNLHHSTLAEQTSPEASPILSSKGMMIPPRKGFATSSSNHEGGGSNPHPSSLWSTMSNVDRTGMASSVGSVNMMESDSTESSSDDHDLTDADDIVDPIITTPQVYKLASAADGGNTTSPFASRTQPSPGGDWMGKYSPAAASLMSFQRARLRKGRSRKSSSSASASGGSSMASPSPASPPAIKSVESSNGYFGKEALGKSNMSRRSSLNWGTRELHLSSGGESDESGPNVVGQSADGNETNVSATPGNEEKRGVIRRAVTRRGNLLVGISILVAPDDVRTDGDSQPKTKNFARIRAALMEEGAPVDTEVKREAEVVRQVRESEPDMDLSHAPSHAETGDSSPIAGLPTVPGMTDIDESIEDDSMGENKTTAGSSRRASECFTLQVKRNSGGKDFWDSFDQTKTPPPPPLFARAGSSAVSEDMNMDSPSLATSLSSSLPTAGQAWQTTQPSSRASTPQLPTQLTSVEISRKIGGKRRRDDDLDTTSFKRRAVSPGMSVQNSPILSQSPAQKEGGGGWWGLPTRGGARDLPSTGNSHGHTTTERANSGSSGTGPVSGGAGVGATGGTKRVGLQGMTDTHDGLMKMSIE